MVSPLNELCFKVSLQHGAQRASKEKWNNVIILKTKTVKPIDAY
ncbi:hypothetical protein TERMP_01320 [Thermococcus barophilus MP]|uniref:Uncharacterized protein n=1 Tax=Thermococcus barophilus (strain DSM 11836 / MP) TaxID=391623 RepID=F0LHG8_THEBM|nr:hypothetical protein TERMP_01320 [Thermococcus barophilus MP]